MTASPSSPLRADDEDPRLRSAYERFLATVVGAQLGAWLPARPATILDISRDDPTRGSRGLYRRMAANGHDVVRAIDVADLRRWPHPTSVPGIRHAAGDIRYLDWFRSSALDGLVAEGSALSSALATETTVEQAARLLRPGGRLLLSVDSLLYGLARLAEQHRWPELADANAGDVVLVPDAADGYTRCFGADELRDLVEAAGFRVDWVRPRTVIPPDVLTHALSRDPSVFDELVATELERAREREGEPLGLYLALSATRR